MVTGLLGNVLSEIGVVRRMGLLGCVPSAALARLSKRRVWGAKGLVVPAGWGTDTDLVVQHEQQRAAHTQVPRPLHLEPICLLGGGRPMPLFRGEELGHVTGPSGLVRLGAPGWSLMQVCAADGTAGLGPVEG